MPILEKRSARKSKSVSTKHTPAPIPDLLHDEPDDGTYHVPDTQPPGRLRQYLPPDDPNSQFDISTTETPEGRLSGRKDSDWYVPKGDEVHLRTDDGRLRLESGDGYGADQFEESSSKYRRDDFKLKTTNAHDHQVCWQVPMTREMASSIMSILRSKKLPFGSSRENFVVIAIYELIQLCMRLEPIPDSHVAVLEAMNDLNRNFQVVVSYDQMMRQHCRTIHDLMERGLKNSARIYVHDLLRDIQRIKSRELREKHLKRVRAEFGSLIEEAKPVSGRPVRTNHKKK